MMESRGLRRSINLEPRRLQGSILGSGGAMRDAGCGLRDSECAMRVARCGIRDAGFGMRDARCGLRDAGCGMRVAASLKFEIRNLKSTQATNPPLRLQLFTYGKGLP